MLYWRNWNPNVIPFACTLMEYSIEFHEWLTWKREQQSFETNAFIITIETHSTNYSTDGDASSLFNCPGPSEELWLAFPLPAAIVTPATNSHVMQLSSTRLSVKLNLMELPENISIYSILRHMVPNVMTSLLLDNEVRVGVKTRAKIPVRTIQLSFLT